MHIGHEFTTTYAMEEGGGLKNLEAIVKERSEVRGAVHAVS